MGLQRVLHIAFPPQCVSCQAIVAEDFALCGTCWRETPFIKGLACHLCGAPMLGEMDEGETNQSLCDDCLTIARPWRAGRAALEYRDNGRKLVLALKHADRLDLARPAARWLLEAAKDLLQDAVIVPIPVHRWRLIHRRYNQAAVLAQALAKLSQRPVVPDALIRTRPTPTQNGKTRNARFENLADAIVATKRMRHLRGAPVLLLDDVMTSGATFAAATEALHHAGIEDVRVLALARAGKEDYIHRDAET